MLDPQPIKAFTIQAIEQTDAQDGDQVRARSHGSSPRLEGMPHLLPGVAVFPGGGLESSFGHNEGQHDSDQDHAQPAELNWDRHIL